MNTLPPQLRIANTAAVLDGPYRAVTRQASLSTLPARPSTATLPKSFKPLKALTNASGFGACKTITTASALTENSSRTTPAGRGPRCRPPRLFRRHGPGGRRPACRRRQPAAAVASATAAERAQLGRWALRPPSKPTPCYPSWMPSPDRGSSRRPPTRSSRPPTVSDGGGATQSVLADRPAGRQTTATRTPGPRNSGGLAESAAGDTRWQHRPGQGVLRCSKERQLRATALADQEDHFHAARGRRALRQQQQRVCRRIDEAAAAHHRERRKARRTGSRPRSTASATARAERRATRPWKPGRPRKWPGRRSPTPCGCSHRQGS